MSKDNLETIINEAKDGNNDAKLKLIEKYKPLVNKYSYNYHIKNYDKDDLIQEANIAILRAIEKYDCSIGRKVFDAYTINTIKNKFNELVRKEAKRNDESSLNAATSDGQDIITLIADTINLEDETIAAFQIKRLNQVLKDLSPNDINIIKEVYFNFNGNLRAYCRENSLVYSTVRARLMKLLHEIGQMVNS